MYLQFGSPETDKFYEEVEKRREAKRQYKDADKCQEAEPKQIIKRTIKLFAKTHTILKLGRLRIILYLRKSHFRYTVTIETDWYSSAWMAWQQKLKKMRERGIL